MGKISVPPCYKYIARCLTTTEERYEFSRYFFEKVSSVGADPDECMILYTSFDMPESVGNPCSYDGDTLNVSDYYERIMGEYKPASSISCPQYYRRYLKPDNRNNICQLCSLSKSYKNGSYEVECALFKYIIADRKNLVKFEELGVGNIFKSCVDIASELSFSLPAIVPLLSTAYSVVCAQPDDVYSTEDIKGRLSELVGRITVDAAKNKNVSSVQMSNHKALPVAWEFAISEILSAKDLNYDEVCAEVSKIDLSTGKRKKSSKKKKPLVPDNPVLEYLNSVESLPENPQDVVPDVTEVAESITESESIPNESTEHEPQDEPQEVETESVSDSTPEYDGEELPFGHADVVEDTSSAETISAESATEEYSDTDISYDGAGDDTDYQTGDPLDQSWYGDADGSSVEPAVDDTDYTDGANDGNSDGDSESVENTEPSEQVQTPQDDKPKVLKYKVPPIDEGDLIFNISINKNTLKNYADSYKSKETEVFTSLQKSKRLPVEVVYDENGAAYLFMFVRAMGQFVYSPISSELPKSLIAILLSKSVIKICYQPYFLYALLRLYDIRACSVYSICTVDTLLHPEAVISPYGDFFAVYAGDFPNITPVDTGFADLDSLLTNMQKYILIHARQTRSPLDRLEYAKRRSRDEVLGSSFLRIINLRGNDYLFSLEPDGKIVYNQNYEQRARHDGFFVTYSVNADDVGGLTLSGIYLDALYELSSKGRFRKYNIQLVTMTNTAMVLFIGESEYELITTALQKYFNRFALTHHMEKFELNVSHQRVYCNSKKSAKQYQIPRTYEQAMDLLITTNDSVSVKESHVVKRSKRKRQRQTNSFDPTQSYDKK